MHPRAHLKARGLRPKKRFGQNFLVDLGTAKRIAGICLQEELAIVEVGPGTGVLTRELAAGSPALTAIEIDGDLAALLRDDPLLGRVRIVEADALEFDFDAANAQRPWCACGNLPYNIATPLILRWLELANVPRRIVVMVQRDVADRFVARPNSPAYGSLSVALQFAMNVKRAFVLSPGAFYPVPKVESAVVVMEPHRIPPVEVADRTFFLKVVRAAFAYRRKTLANSLTLALDIPRERTHEALQRLGRPTEIRAEQIDLSEFAALVRELAA